MNVSQTWLESVFPERVYGIAGGKERGTCHLCRGRRGSSVHLGKGKTSAKELRVISLSTSSHNCLLFQHAASQFCGAARLGSPHARYYARRRRCRGLALNHESTNGRGEPRGREREITKLRRESPAHLRLIARIWEQGALSGSLRRSWLFSDSVIESGRERLEAPFFSRSDDQSWEALDSIGPVNGLLNHVRGEVSFRI